MSASIECEAGSVSMEGRRTCDIDEIRGFAVEHQREVVVNAEVEAEVDGDVAASRDRIVDGSQAYVITRVPSGEMGLRGDFAKAGNNPA